jgi:hypothetical protein
MDSNNEDFQPGDTVILLRRLRKGKPHIAFVITSIGAWLEVKIPGESQFDWIPVDDVIKVEEWDDQWDDDPTSPGG